VRWKRQPVPAFEPEMPDGTKIATIKIYFLGAFLETVHQL